MESVKRGKVLCKQPCPLEYQFWKKEEEEALKLTILKHNAKNWPKISQAFRTKYPNFTDEQIEGKWRNYISANSILGRGRWSKEEDAILIKGVETYGNQWTVIARSLPLRGPHKCRDRYINYLSPALTNLDWTPEEDQILLESRDELGNRWVDIAKRLPGRPVSGIKNRWYGMSRRQMSLNAGVGSRQFDRVKNDAASYRWTAEETEAVREAVARIGTDDWVKVAEFVPGKSNYQCRDHWTECANPALVKGRGSWSEADDARLRQLVKQYGTKWTKISSFMTGRYGKQVRERWLNHVDPTLVKGEWTAEEDAKLDHFHKIHFNKWTIIAKELPGRSANDVKNRWYKNVSKSFAETCEKITAVTASKVRPAAGIANNEQHVSKKKRVGPSSVLGTTSAFKKANNIDRNENTVPNSAEDGIIGRITI